MTELSILKVVESTTVDGPGFRTSVYSAGCNHACPGCHNPQSWDITHGEWTNIDHIVHTIAENRTEQVTFTGGDPFFQAEGFTVLAKKIKEELNRNIWCYTGYKFEKLLKIPAFVNLLQYIDVLVDGPFEIERRDITLRFRGSSNQRFIDVQASLKAACTIEVTY